MDQEVHYLIHSIPLPVLILSQIDSIHALLTDFFKLHCNILPSMYRSSKWFLSLVFPHQNHVRPSPLPHTCHMPCPFHILHFITPIIFCEVQKWRRPSLCRLLQFPVTSSLLGPKSSAHFPTLSAYVLPSKGQTKFPTHIKHKTITWFVIFSCLCFCETDSKTKYSKPNYRRNCRSSTRP